MTSSGGLDRSRPTNRSIAGTTIRMMIGPIQSQTPHPVSWWPTNATRASDGTTRPISHRYRFLSVHLALEPCGTVELAMVSWLAIDLSSARVVHLGTRCRTLYTTVGDVKRFDKRTANV